MTPEEINRANRGKRLFEALRDEDSELCFVQYELNQSVDRARVSLENYRPGKFSLEYYLGRLHQAQDNSSILAEEIRQAGELYALMVEENRISGPQNDTAPQGSTENK